MVSRDQLISPVYALYFELLDWVRTNAARQFSYNKLVHMFLCLLTLRSSRFRPKNIRREKYGRFDIREDSALSIRHKCPVSAARRVVGYDALCTACTSLTGVSNTGEEQWHKWTRSDLSRKHTS